MCKNRHVPIYTGYYNVSSAISDKFAGNDYIIGNFEQRGRTSVILDTPETHKNKAKYLVNVDNYYMAVFHNEYMGETDFTVGDKTAMQIIEEGMRLWDYTYEQVNGNTVHFNVVIKPKSATDSANQQYLSWYINDTYLDKTQGSGKEWHDEQRSHANFGSNNVAMYQFTRSHIRGVVAHELGHIMSLPDGYLEYNKSGVEIRSRAPVELTNHNDLMVQAGTPYRISNLHIAMIINHMNNATRPKWKDSAYDNYRPSAADNLATMPVGGINEGMTNAQIIAATQQRITDFNNDKAIRLATAQTDIANATTDTQRATIQSWIDTIQRSRYSYGERDNLNNTNLWYCYRAVQ